MANETIVRFEDVSFEYVADKPTIKEVNFSIREGSKITIMGQNGAGKSTIFKLITKEITPHIGRIHTPKEATIAIAFQVMKLEDKTKTLREFFRTYYKWDEFNIDAKIDKILDVVHLKAPLERIVKSFSGGQQARLLLAAALIQNPDILLLDEPTNNLDAEGISHLTYFIQNYKKTVIVISHDAEFLNAFTDGVLYLDNHTKVVEQYVGNYYNVVDQITARIEKENMKNAQMEKQASEKKAQAEVFAHKWGKLRMVAKKMREAAAELEENMVDVRREDKTIRDFVIPAQEEMVGTIITFSSLQVIKNHEAVEKPVSISMRKNHHLLLVGPNGIGKSTLLESIVSGKGKWVHIQDGIRVGYYRQDFSNLDFNQTVYECLKQGAGKSMGEQEMRSIAAGFLITWELMKSQVGNISEGQKWLVAFARLVMQRPGLLILDEPTNHINFRHIPVIAKALDEYEWAMILVSHVNEFLRQIRIDQELDLAKL